MLWANMHQEGPRDNAIGGTCLANGGGGGVGGY